MNEEFLGWVPAAKYRDVTFYYSQSADKFVDMDKLTLNDVYLTEYDANFAIKPEEWPAVEEFLPLAKIYVKLSTDD